MPTLEHSELLPQSKIFELQVATSAKRTDNCAETEPDDGEHRSDIAESLENLIDCKLLIAKPSRVLARDRGHLIPDSTPLGVRWVLVRRAGARWRRYGSY
jgi:hypothetical protein